MDHKCKGVSFEGAMGLVLVSGNGDGVRLKGLGVLDDCGWCNEMLKGDLKVGNQVSRGM